jgi:hypothetical protein
MRSLEFSIYLIIPAALWPWLSTVTNFMKEGAVIGRNAAILVT